LSLDTSEAFSRSVVRQLSKLRQAKGVTKERLAKLSGISRSMISMMESDQRHPTVVTVHALAGALETTVTELLSGLESLKASRKKPSG
jgi:XRE family transcriptional regulator, regulator of sulfur utilization